MTSVERKRATGYSEMVLTHYCGNCRWCVRRSTHLKCDRFVFPVTQYGICRAGYEPHDMPLNPVDHPLLAKEHDDDQA